MPHDGSAISGALLKRRLREANFFLHSDSKRPAKNREQGQLNSALHRLLEWQAVSAGFHGTRRWYRLGPTGSLFAAMFASQTQ
jgi:hypothetical protein